MDSEDGQVFIKHLAYFVRTHERALANALHLQRQHSKNGQPQSTAGASSGAAATRLSAALSRPSLLPFTAANGSNNTTSNIKPAKLTLTPHHLFYLLSKFEDDLGVDIGPMNVRLETLQYDAGPSNYVSFLGRAPKSRGKQSDADSLKSVSSVRSVVSSMSSLWSNITLANSTAKAEKQMAQYREDIRYLYSSFTKVPALKLSPDHRVRLVTGYEEFPFDTAVPLFAFKNVSALEICDLDFRQFHGWDRLSEHLRSLTVRNANIDDPIDLLQHIVLDDTEKRRKRSFKNHHPTTPSTPGAPWPTNSPKARQIELARTYSAPSSPLVDQQRGFKNSPHSPILHGKVSSDDRQQRQHSTSPPQTPSSRYARTGSLKYRRSSGSSGSSTHETAPRHSSSDLVPLSILPPSKWRFLRHLSLADNALTFLAAASLAPVASTLQSLDLSGNLFSEVPDALASLTHLRALNLSNCMIDGLQSLSRSPIPAITTLNLRSNRLGNLAGIERLLSLERVDVRDNRLRDPMELARLAALPDIIDLYVVKNPFTRTHSNYRVTIFNAFRSTPGHTQDISIDTLGPSYNEKKQLVDRAPEPANVPVVKPPLEDDEEPQAVSGGAPTDAELRSLTSEATTSRHTHRRTSSDIGPTPLPRKKKPPRRRMVDLSQAEPPKTPPPARLTVQQATPPLTEGPKTPTDSDHPPSPGDTPYHTAPSTQLATKSPHRPGLNTSFTSPTRTPQIRDPSDDDLSPQDDDDGGGHSGQLYRQKIQALKTDLGPHWLAAMNNNPSEEQQQQQQQSRRRSFSPASRASTVKAEAGVGRTLG